ncbi:hypothetical protein ACFFK0_03555 [Paenibacillus chartarius]|uniref:LysM domain-containing protein n=1 Tax=Paenibacillus chartarius TaxID=747481 RepID=A0ABV6DFY6_9BACL
MKPWSKKMMTGTLAAALLIGGAAVAVQQQKAYAATNSTDGAASAQADAGKAFGRGGERGKGGFHGGMQVTKEAAALIGIDEAALRTELGQGKTLAQVAQEKAGLSEADLLQKLVDAQTKAIDDAVAAGKLTQEQADRQKAGLNEQVQQQITSVLPAGGEPGKRGGKGMGRGLGGMFGGQEQIAALLGMTEDELKTALQSGQSLADIAQEHGVSRDQLISQIKSGLDEEIGQFIDRKMPPKAPASTETTAPAAPAADTSVTGA